MNPFEIEEIMFDLLLHSNYEKIRNLYLVSKLANKICKDKNFWLLKFDHDNIPIIPGYGCCYGEYMKYLEYSLIVDDIVTISLLEKELDKGSNILYKNNGYLILKSDKWCDEREFDKINKILPKTFTEEIITKLGDFQCYPLNIEFEYIEETNEYDMEYLIGSNDEDGQEEFEFNKCVTQNEMKNILILFIYSFRDFECIVDGFLQPYVFTNYDYYPKTRTNSNYYNTVKFRRIGMFEMLKHQRKQKMIIC